MENHGLLIPLVEVSNKPPGKGLPVRLSEVAAPPPWSSGHRTVARPPARPWPSEMSGSPIWRSMPFADLAKEVCFRRKSLHVAQNCRPAGGPEVLVEAHRQVFCRTGQERASGCSCLVWRELAEFPALIGRARARVCIGQSSHILSVTYIRKVIICQMNVSGELPRRPVPHDHASLAVTAGNG